MSRRSNGRHRRRGPLRRALPAVATAAGSVALVTTIGTAAFVLVPGDERRPFGGAGPDSGDAAPPTAGLLSPTSSTVPSISGATPGAGSGTEQGQAGPQGGSDADSQSRATGADGPAGGTAARPRSRPPSASQGTPQPRRSTTEPTDDTPLPLPTPPLVTATILPTFLSLTASGSVTSLP